MRRICRIGGVNVEKPGMRIVAGGIAIAIGEIGGGATTCVLLAAGGLRKLADRGIRNFAGGGERGGFWGGASWWGGGGAVEEPVGPRTVRAVVLAEAVGRE